MAAKYVAFEKDTGHVLSSPSEFREPDTGILAMRLWSWVPDPDGRKGHHFASRSDAKAAVRAQGVDLSGISFRKAA